MLTFTISSFGLAAGFFGLLGLLLLTSWRSKVSGSMLVFAVLISLVWSISAVATVWFPKSAFTGPFYIVSEVVRTIAWLVLLVVLVRPLIQLKTAVIAYSLVLAIGAVVVLVELFPIPAISVVTQFKVAILGHLALALSGLVLIEQLIRNTRPEHRWATKYLYVGLGTIFIYDFFLYTEALLLQRINVQIWAARGALNAMVVPLLAVSAVRNPNWSLDIFVSRQVVLHTATIIGAGFYLIAMAGVGYYIRYVGGGWGFAFQLIFFGAAGVLLLTLLFSGQLRSTLQVFLSKHFFNYKYDYRDEWLRFSDTLAAADSEAAEPARERAIKAIAQIVHSPGGYLFSRSVDGEVRLSATWCSPQPEFVDRGAIVRLVAFLEDQQWVVDLADVKRHPERYGTLGFPTAIEGLPSARIVVPLTQVDQVLGFVLLAQPLVKQELNWEDWDLLKTVGRDVAGFIALLETSDQLANARQFEAFNRLSAFVVHDLKNVAAQLDLVVTNSVKHKDNAEFVDDAIATVGNATGRMHRMLQQLRKGRGDSDDARRFCVNDALVEVQEAAAIRLPLIVLELPDAQVYLFASRDRYVDVVSHLVQNAQEATADDGSVAIAVSHTAERFWVTIRDTGCGMTAEFIRDQLFRPFSTTKGNAGMGIGVFESREFANALGGELTVRSQPAEGTEFVLNLPQAATIARSDKR